MDYLRGPIQRKRLQDDTDLVSKYSHCLHSLLGMNCFASHFSRECDFGAAELAIELLEKKQQAWGNNVQPPSTLISLIC
ncbi:hypothetical protein CEXT_508621 [Caerostris extrusa]|uniref:Uncharacterized protein n=1 Tax=Caerostris extrusa TaxID=172846 RepID=A0AAV4T6Z2_CAEEX|nr:hypothetical protein CEXT_508621 [Caerostris extrusa]